MLIAQLGLVASSGKSPGCSKSLLFCSDMRYTAFQVMSNQFPTVFTLARANLLSLCSTTNSEFTPLTGTVELVSPNRVHKP